MNEEFKYQVIKKLVDSDGNKNTAALKLGCTRRTVNRMIKGYVEEGKAFFLHGNRGRRPAVAFDKKIKTKVIDLYRTKYLDANIAHFSELLAIHENISISPSSIRSFLLEKNILSPKATRASKRKMRLRLQEQKRKATYKKEILSISQDIVKLEDAHPRRPRSPYFGEMIQMDASVHLWFGSQKAYLHIAIDDSTGAIVGAFFDHQETLNGYYNVLYQILNNHGIPFMFYTDRRTVFEYKLKKSPSLEEDTFTQFGYACKQLGIDIKTTSSPQAKGRVERLFQTLQSRLPIELRLAGATTMEEANIFLNSYIKEYNAMFSLPLDTTKSVFEKQPDKEKTNLILSVISSRRIDNGHCISFKKKYFVPVDSSGSPVYFPKSTNCLVIQAFDSNLYVSIKDLIYALDEVPVHDAVSENFDFVSQKIAPKERAIPKPSHPWRTSVFIKHLKQQRHRVVTDVTFDELIYSQEKHFSGMR